MKSGFTLIEVLVVIGIMSATSLITLKMIENQQNGVKYTEVRLNELELYRQIQLNLSMRSACVETFVTRTAASGGVALSSTGSEINAIYQAPPKPLTAGYAGVKIIETGVKYDGYKVTNLKIVDKNPSAFGSIGNATLEIHTERLFKGMPKTQRKDLGIYVAKDASDIITDCYIDEDSLMKSMCESLSGTWDISQSPPKCIKPNDLLEEMCLSMGGSWEIPVPVDPVDPTAKKCLNIVSYDPAQCDATKGFLATKLDPSSKKLICSKMIIHTLDLAGSGSNNKNLNLGAFQFCALERVRWNPQNANPGTFFECEITQSGSNWILHAERRTQNDNIKCRAICF